jgi:hypothetical protein
MRSKDGMLIHDKKLQNFGPALEEGDVLGVRL